MIAAMKHDVLPEQRRQVLHIGIVDHHPQAPQMIRAASIERIFHTTMALIIRLIRVGRFN